MFDAAACDITKREIVRWKGKREKRVSKKNVRAYIREQACVCAR